MANITDAIKQKPDERPLTPSIRFIAFIMPTAAKIVSGAAIQTGMKFIPHKPQKWFMPLLFTSIMNATTTISMMKRVRG